jgi:hypothetical protein
MTAKPDIAPKKDHPFWGAAVLVGAIGIALVSARPYAGGWNDGSRLATVESIVDHHTLAIDDSIFVKVPHEANAQTRGPYDPAEPGLSLFGTTDKLYIRGKYYSDKSPVPALLLAGVYQVLQWTTGLKASQAPDRFCYALTVCSSGLAYVASVWFVFRLGLVLQLPMAARLVLTASLACATMALPYVRHVNNHILLLGVSAAIVLQLTQLAEECPIGKVVPVRLTLLGTLAGLGYSIDLGAGPVLFLAVLAVVAWRCRRITAVLQCFLVGLPWILVHHAVNYSVGGTFQPANAVPEYFRWPGCPFTEATLTGAWHGRPWLRTLGYSLDLLLGKTGFLGHNLPILAAVLLVVPLLRRVPEARPEILFAIGWSLATWLAYGLTSTNYSGRCCSVRWFLPLLAPGYLILAQLLRRWPEKIRDLWILTAWGGALGVVMWWLGPWNRVPGLVYWPLVIGALASWLAGSNLRSSKELSLVQETPPASQALSQAA